MYLGTAVQKSENAQTEKFCEFADSAGEWDSLHVPSANAGVRPGVGEPSDCAA